MLRKTPKTLNAVDMVLAVIRECFVMVQTVMLPPAPERVVAAEGVGVVHRSLSGMFLDMRHQFVGGHLFHHLGIDPAIALQQAENNAFAGSSAPTLPLAPAAEVRLINLNLSLEFARFQFRHMVDRLAQALIDAAHRLVIYAQIVRHAIGRLLLVEAGENRDFFTQLPERLLFPADLVATPHIAASRFVYPERAAENALSTSQKVGRTVENVLLTSNHKGIVTPRGYETH